MPRARAMVELDKFDQDYITREAAVDIAIGNVISYTPGNGLTVKLTSANAVSGLVIGVALTSAKAGEQVRVCLRGVCEALINGSVSGGLALKLSGTAGQFSGDGNPVDGTRFVIDEASPSGLDLKRIFITY